MGGRARRVLARLLLASLGIALGLLATEAGVRLLHLVPTRFWEPDPLLGTRLVAGREGWWTQEHREFTTPVRISRAGLRDVEHDLAKPPGTFRILLLGDSFIEALQVPLEATLGRQLEGRLNRAGAGARYEVISLGVSGYGTASQLLAYRTIGRAYAPDLVLLAFYAGNDVRNNSPTLEPVLRPVYDGSGTLQRVEPPAEALVRRRAPAGWRKLLAATHTYKFVRKLLLTRQPQLAQQLQRWGVVDSGALRALPLREGVPLDYWVYAPAPPPEWAHAWTRTEGLLEAARDEARNDGARFAVLLVAAPEQIDRGVWDSILESYPAMRGRRWELGGPERRVMRWCRTQRVACLRLSRVFGARRGAAPRLHFLHDGHWTEAGHALAAETTAGFLRDAGMLRGKGEAER